MYVGRIVAAGRTPDGMNAGMYRVSSRSFPNREAREIDGNISIMPRKGYEDDINKNPYIAYNCVRFAGNWAVVTNGSHTDPVAEKILSGMNVRDALTLSLMTLDYEKDSYNTPRIAAIVPLAGDSAFLGIVRKDAVLVNEFELEAGKSFYVATYERNTPSLNQCCGEFDASDAESCCSYIIGEGVYCGFEHPVTAASVLSVGGKFQTAVETV